eukprot:5269760-Alexandrium_andersonii.AAC.1
MPPATRQARTPWRRSVGCSQGKEATELPTPPRPPMPSATPTQMGAEMAGRNPFEPRGTGNRFIAL